MNSQNAPSRTGRQSPLIFAPAVAVLLLAACGQSAPAAGPAASAAPPSPTATATAQPAAPLSPVTTATAQLAPPSPTTSVRTAAPTPTTAPVAATATATPDLAAVARGKAVFASAGCGLCHTIQGVSTGNQCPDLTHIGSQPIPSPPWDTLPNDPAFLQRWIKNPQAIKPGNLMPDLGLTDQQVSDVVAFLETQR